MNKAEFIRMQQRIHNVRPHIMYSRAYEVWFCLGQSCIGQGADRPEAYSHWDSIRGQADAGKRHVEAQQREHEEQQRRQLPTRMSWSEPS